MPYSGWIYFRKKTGTCCDTLPTKWMDFFLSFVLFKSSPQQSIAALPFTTWNCSTGSAISIEQIFTLVPVFDFFFLPVVLKQWDCLLPLLLDTSLGLPHDIHLWLLKKNQETNSYYLFVIVLSVGELFQGRKNLGCLLVF